MIKFRVRIGNEEVRSCNKHLTLDGTHSQIEMVRFKIGPDGKEYCYTTEVYERTWKRQKEKSEKGESL